LPEPGEASGDPGAKTAALKSAILARGIALESVDTSMARWARRAADAFGS
jgi:hypothetical protein